MIRPVIYVSDILAWADAYKKRTGRWPKRHSGPVAGQIDVTWCGIDLALRNGNRGLTKGSSLPQLLAEHRGVRNIARLPKFTIAQILIWVDAHRQRTGQWPNPTSGSVQEKPSETWFMVDRALTKGNRGLPGGSSLPRLLAMYRGVRNPSGLPDFQEECVLAWADAFYQRHGRWPQADDGAIPESPSETWMHVTNAFYAGSRGLTKSSLAAFLVRHRGARRRKHLPPFTVAEILMWASLHRQRTGHWPTHTSGAISDAPEETWGNVHEALRCGLRGLPGGSSLYRLLGEARRVDRWLNAKRKNESFQVGKASRLKRNRSGISNSAQRTRA